MHWTKAEIAAWAIAILGILAMGALVAHGSFNSINKTEAKVAFTPLSVTIEDAPANRAREVGIYLPKIARAHVGQTVTWTNNSSAGHTVTQDQNLFGSGNIDKGSATWSFTPTKPGKYGYYCIYHLHMHGTLIVQP
jgi:plastocyanin